MDGHEREDVICSRDLYVKRMKTLEGMHQARPPCPDEPDLDQSGNDGGKKKLVLIFHDEKVFFMQINPSHGCGLQRISVS